MKNLTWTLLVCTAVLVTSHSISNAASVYSASATAVVSFTTSNIDDLEFAGSTVTYSARAVATSNGSSDTREDSGSLSKGPDDGAFSDNGNLGSLLVTPTDPKDNFTPGKVVAEAGGAEATADTTQSRFPVEGNVATFKAAVEGIASQPVETASSNDVWNILIQFTNTGTETLTAIWTIDYFLNNTASADPRGTAGAGSDVRVQGGNVINGVRDRSTEVVREENAACDPPTSDCKSEPPPPILGGRITADFTVGKGETKYLNFRLEAHGNATVVPVPAALPLLFSGLGLLALLGWRRRRTCNDDGTIQ